MTSMRVDFDTMDWASAVSFYGPNAVYQGRDIVQLKVLSDRRGEGGGIAWLVRFSPPRHRARKRQLRGTPTRGRDRMRRRGEDRGEYQVSTSTTSSETTSSGSPV